MNLTYFDQYFSKGLPTNHQLDNQRKYHESKIVTPPPSEKFHKALKKGKPNGS